MVITSDINVHLEDASNRDAERFRCIVSAHGMQQHVKEPTHTGGHTLDMVLTHDGDSILRGSVDVSDPASCTNRDGTPVSDHFALSSQVSATKSKPIRQEVKYRKYTDI